MKLKFKKPEIETVQVCKTCWDDMRFGFDNSYHHLDASIECFFCGEENSEHVLEFDYKGQFYHYHACNKCKKKIEKFGFHTCAVTKEPLIHPDDGSQCKVCGKYYSITLLKNKICPKCMEK